MKLRQFLARRRWQRFGQAIRAMKRMSGDRVGRSCFLLTGCTLDIMIRRRSLRNSVTSLNGSSDSWSGLKRHSSFDFAESTEESGTESLSQSLESLQESCSAPVIMRYGLLFI